MKKLYIVLILLVSTVSFGQGEPLTQEELVARLKENLMLAPQFDKFQQIEARGAVAGEEIQTITSDGLETVNTAGTGDFVVRNNTVAGEMYIIAGDRFATRYEPIEEGSPWSRYRAIGSVKGILVDDQFLEGIGQEDEFYIIAAWGQEMVVKKGDYLVSPLDYSEVYRIAYKEFFETYRETK